MAVKAYMLIETASGKSTEVTSALKRMDCVKSAIPVAGPYDIIALAEAETISDMGDLVMVKIKPVDGVTRMMTCLITEEINNRFVYPIRGNRSPRGISNGL